MPPGNARSALGSPVLIDDLSSPTTVQNPGSPNIRTSERID
jgi:hypothetical protein